MTPAAALHLLSRLADLADPIALQWFRSGALDVSAKPDASPVTQADLAIERTVRTAALSAHPELALLGEEYGLQHASSRTRLIVDPIDATANFARGIPIFATLLAIEHEGTLVAGVASAPALSTRWSAARGSGALRNAVPIRVSSIASIEHAQVFHGGLGGAERLEKLPGLLALLRRSKRQRGFGDFYQHVLVAEGAGEIAADAGLAAWDIAALAIIVTEAGGNVTTLDGRFDLEGGTFVSTNALLHEVALTTLRAAVPPDSDGKTL